MARFQKKRKERGTFEAKKPAFEAPPLRPMTEKQREYIRILYSCEQCFTLGNAGSGKTFIASAVGAEMVKAGTMEKIVLCRPTVPVDDEELGFLPGGISSKMAPWVIPFVENIEKRVGKNEVRTWLSNGKIEVVPLAFARGRTFENSYIIVDEAQNCSYSQIKMILTRVGAGSKIILNGDISQVDLKRDSGLAEFIDIIDDYGLAIPIIEFTKDDVVRSGVCQVWTAVLEDYERNSEEV